MIYNESESKKMLQISRKIDKIFISGKCTGMLPYLVREITRLSQEEGLTDKEIADVFGCSRATVNRTRIKYNIPTANLKERNDKEYQCVFCKKIVRIRRKERKKRYCEECREELNINKTSENT